MDRGDPLEGFGRISRVIETGSPLDCLRFAGGPAAEAKGSIAPGADLRLIPELALGTGRLWL